MALRSKMQKSFVCHEMNFWSHYNCPRTRKSTTTATRSAGELIISHARVVQRCKDSCGHLVASTECNISARARQRTLNGAWWRT